MSLVCSHPLPRLVAEPMPHDGEVTVELGFVPFDLPLEPADGWKLVHQSRCDDPLEEPILRIWRGSAEGLYRFFYRDGTEFFIDRRGRRVWAQWAEPYTLEDVETYLLGPILGFVLRLRGVITLHASAVVIDGAAVALAGSPGAGKSTTAAAFAQSGYPILSDDVTALSPTGGDFVVHAYCPVLYLWPQAAEMLFGSSEALPRLSLTWNKRFLELEPHGYRAQRTPCPLAAVYLLGGRSLDSRRLEFQELGVRSGFVALVANCYAHAVDRQMHVHEFDSLARLRPRLSVLQVNQPAAGLTPRDLCDSIATDFRRFRAGSDATRCPSPDV